MGCVIAAIPVAIIAIVFTQQVGNLLLVEEVARPLPAFVGGLSVLALLLGTAGAMLVGRPRAGLKDVASPPVGAVVSVGCPTCGAPGELRYGQQLGTCSYCHSALVPGAEAQAALLEAGRVAEWHAKLASVRAERHLDIEANTDAANGTPWMTMTVLSVAPTAAATLIGIQSLDEEVGFLGYLIFWALLLGSVALWSTWKLWRLAKLRTLERGLRDVAVQLQGRPSRRFADALAWLDHYWCDSLDFQWLGEHPSFGCVSARVLGLSCYADVLPEVPDIANKARAMVLVAAVLPETGPATQRKALAAPAARPWAAAIHRLGFQIELTEGGVQAVRDGRVYWRKPGQVHELAAVMCNACRLALALGGRAPPQQ